MDLLWLLLPLAAASGWYVGRRSFSDGDRDSRQELRSGYFKGINYLLNEQPDKAIEVFIKLLEVDRETVETHLALGNLYRRRGEVDRAIRIHQNLIARPTLSAEQRSEALLELGQDYLSAGLLDRAENLFKELTDNDSYRVQALRQLIDIYEQEKDWEQAIASARRLEKVTGNQLGAVVAHYYCEQAQSLAAQGNVDTALGVLEQAIRAHRSCVRATLLEGDIRAGCADHERALAVFRRVEEQDPDYLPEVVGRMEECFKALGRIDDLQSYFQHLAQTYGSVGATLALSEIEREEHGAREAVRFIANQLRRRASVRGFDKLLQLELMQARDQRPEYLDVLKGLTDELLEDRAAYQCQHCGFPARSLHWQCPSCKHWSSIKRLQGVEDG